MMPTSPLGREIFRTYDEYGPIQVFDDGSHRYLSFGEGDEQSCLLKERPAVLQHDYTRAMLLPLLFKRPRDALLVGLGGGALASCLYHNLPELQLRAIERRPAVVKAAYRYFELPRSERLQIINGDVSDLIEDAGLAPTDMLFSDVYGAEGMEPQFFQPWYIEACHRRLADDGWLILNCWEDHRDERDTQEALADCFAEIYTCTVPSGNWIILASKQPNRLNEAELKARAKAQSAKFGYSVTQYLKELYQVSLDTFERARIG